MFYYLYQITNLVNAKIYVGIHKTKSLEDGYMGSGKVIKSAIKKHGILNFKKVILEHFDTSEAMYAREKEVVNEEFLCREDVYNIRRGGTGGFDYINREGLHGFSNIEIAKIGRKKTNELLKELYGDNWNSIISKIGGNVTANKFRNDDEYRIKTLTNLAKGTLKAKSKESLSKRKETFVKIGHQQGEKNSAFGKMWITNNIENKMIKKTDSIPIGFRKGRIQLS